MTTNNNPTTNRPTFEQAKRAYEQAHRDGLDLGKPTLDLATAVAYSVLAKVLDPQRSTAPTRETVSNNGMNPALVGFRRDIAHGLATLDNLARLTDTATVTTYTADGDPVTETADHDSLTALGDIIGMTLGDGFDLVQTASVALAEVTADYAGEGEWLDRPVTVTRLARRVLTKGGEAEWVTKEVTPMQEVYRAVRRAIMTSKAVQADPRNGYSYIEDFATNDRGGLEAIYHRLGKYADLGGADCNGLYTADLQTALDYDTALARLDLTAREAVIVDLRMRGYGNKAIARYLGLVDKNGTPNASIVRRHLARIADKATALGMTANK